MVDRIAPPLRRQRPPGQGRHVNFHVPIDHRASAQIPSPSSMISASPGPRPAAPTSVRRPSQNGLPRVSARLGYMDAPNVPEVLRLVETAEIEA